MVEHKAVIEEADRVGDLGQRNIDDLAVFNAVGREIGNDDHLIGVVNAGGRVRARLTPLVLTAEPASVSDTLKELAVRPEAST